MGEDKRIKELKGYGVLWGMTKMFFKISCGEGCTTLWIETTELYIFNRGIIGYSNCTSIKLLPKYDRDKALLLSS